MPTLRQLSRASVTEADLESFLAEVEGQSDRTACIIFSSVLERELEQALITRLRVKIEPPFDDLLFERDRALSSFYGNILLGRALGLYDDNAKDHMDSIRKIRNAFAHSAAPISLQTEQIKRELQKVQHYLELAALTLPPHESYERKLFISCCYSLCALLSIREHECEDENIVAEAAIELYRASLNKTRTNNPDETIPSNGSRC